MFDRTANVKNALVDYIAKTVFKRLETGLSAAEGLTKQQLRDDVTSASVLVVDLLVEALQKHLNGNARVREFYSNAQVDVSNGRPQAGFYLDQPIIYLDKVSFYYGFKKVITILELQNRFMVEMLIGQPNSRAWVAFSTSRVASFFNESLHPNGGYYIRNLLKELLWKDTKFIPALINGAAKYGRANSKAMYQLFAKDDPIAELTFDKNGHAAVSGFFEGGELLVFIELPFDVEIPDKNPI